MSPAAVLWEPENDAPAGNMVCLQKAGYVI